MLSQGRMRRLESQREIVAWQVAWELNAWRKEGSEPLTPDLILGRVRRIDVSALAESGGKDAVDRALKELGGDGE